jgi:hypothetical protein
MLTLQIGLVRGAYALTVFALMITLTDAAGAAIKAQKQGEVRRVGQRRERRGRRD